jgi:hypothetical protein
LKAAVRGQRDHVINPLAEGKLIANNIASSFFVIMNGWMIADLTMTNGSSIFKTLIHMIHYLLSKRLCIPETVLPSSHGKKEIYCQQHRDLLLRSHVLYIEADTKITEHEVPEGSSFLFLHQLRFSY